MQPHQRVFFWCWEIPNYIEIQNKVSMNHLSYSYSHDINPKSQCFSTAQTSMEGPTVVNCHCQFRRCLHAPRSTAVRSTFFLRKRRKTSNMPLLHFHGFGLLEDVPLGPTWIHARSLEEITRLLRNKDRPAGWSSRVGPTVHHRPTVVDDEVFQSDGVE